MKRVLAGIAGSALLAGVAMLWASLAGVSLAQMVEAAWDVVGPLLLVGGIVVAAWFGIALLKYAASGDWPWSDWEAPPPPERKVELDEP